MTKFVFPARSCNILYILAMWYVKWTCSKLGICMLFVERGVWCFKITGQFIKRGQVKQNFFIFLTDFYLPPSILPMISFAFYYYLSNKFRITFASFAVFSRIILSLTLRIAKLVAFYVAFDPCLRHHTQLDQFL